ncbi:MlaD family protein [Lutibacter sp.]|uniref:MlaD family protein n=1 Tax=Lutibacter sp. TaxID=1925666 RepID=UPI003563C94C
MKQTSTQKFYLGLFIIISTIVLIIALYFIGNRQNLFGKTFKINAVFNNVNGLQLGNNVRYSGINVGTVKKIEMVNDTTICVEMIVENKFLNHLKKNAVAAIGSDGLVGSMVINIVPNHKEAPNLIPGDTIKSYSKISTNDMLETLNATNENAAILTSDLLKITSAINQGKGTLGMLIKDPELASNLQHTVLNLKIASNDAAKTIKEIKQIVEAINYEESIASTLLSDSISANKIKSIITNLNKSSVEINKVVTNLNSTITTMKDGKGAINYLLTDTLLVKNIDSTMLNIKKGSVKLNEDLEALKHNFLLRGYFRKLEKEKEKAAKKNAPN